MLKTKVSIDIFWTKLSYFLSFQNSRQTYCDGQGGGRQGGGGQGGGRQRGGGAGHIGAGLILSASYLIGFNLVLFYV